MPVHHVSHIAVYGTLRPGQRAGEIMSSLDNVAYVSPCVIPGRIYNLGTFPGLKEEDGTVVGDLFSVSTNTSMINALALLDRYEGYLEGRERNLYIRKAIKLIHPELYAWVYVYAHETQLVSLIPNGDWRTR